MPVRITCNACRSSFTVPDELAGMSIRCRVCRKAIRIAKTDAAIPEVQAVDEPAPLHRIQAAPGTVPPVVPPAVPTAERAGRSRPPRPEKPRSSSLGLIMLGLAGFMMMLVILIVVIGVIVVYRWQQGTTDSTTVVRIDDTVKMNDAAPAPRAAEDRPQPTPPPREPDPVRPPPQPMPAGKHDQLSPAMLAFLKDLTVFVKVDAGQLQGSGSGFLIKVDGETGYIVTNDHVANPEPPRNEPAGPGMPFGPFGPGGPGMGPFGPIGPGMGPFGPGPGMGPFGPGPGFPPGMGGPFGPGLPPMPRLFEPPAARGRVNARLTVVVHSGTERERELPAEVIDSEPDQDLAILRVRGAGLPRPINLADRAAVAETMPVYIVGYPFGEQLGFDKNPAVNLALAAVTALRSDRDNKPLLVQLQGEIHPGNSGGPVVDAKGRLTGVAVAKIRNTQIGFAIAPQVLEGVLHRGKATATVTSAVSSPTEAQLTAEIELLDLFDEYEHVNLLRAPSGPVNPTAGADGTFAILENSTPIALTRAGHKFSGVATVGLPDYPGGILALQIQFKRRDGKVEYGRPWAHRVAAAGGNRAAPAAGQRIYEPAPPLAVPDRTLALGGPIGHVVVGGAGRLLILHQPMSKKLAVFDARQGRIVAEILVAEDRPLFAAGRDHLIVYRPQANQLQRYSLPDGKLEASAASPIAGEIKALAMGSASAGPLVAFVPPSKLAATGLSLIDPATLALSKDTIEPVVGQRLRPQLQNDVLNLALSADGRTLVQRWTIEWCVWTRQGVTWRGSKFRGDTPLPSADGQTLIDHGQAFRPDGTSMSEKRGGHGRAVWCVPAAQGGLSLSINEVYEQGAAECYLKAMLHVAGRPQPIAAFPKRIADLRDLVDWIMGRPRPFERHVFYLPEDGLLLMIPAKKDRIDTYRFPLDELLKETKQDYLFVSNQPNTIARRGEEYRHRLAVQSRAGGLKMSLSHAPAGMKLAADGTLTWPVPKEFTARKVEVGLSMTDAAGQQANCRFMVDVREK